MKLQTEPVQVPQAHCWSVKTVGGWVLVRRPEPHPRNSDVSVHWQGERGMAFEL